MKTGNIQIRNAKLIDGTGKPVQEGITIAIRNGKIDEIGDRINVDDIPQLDVDGAYVLPGLIDSHVHLMWGPGAVIQNYETSTEKNWKQGWGKYYPHYLKAYLACGVTTILDVGSPPYVIHEIRQHLSDGGPGPNYLTLGPFLAPPNGYGSFFYHNPASPEAVEEHLNILQSLNIHGIKITIEKGWSVLGGSYPMHSASVLQAIKQGADKRKLPIYVHATCEEDQRTALKLGVHALAHTLISRKKKLSDDLIQLMKTSASHQMSTLSTMDAELTYFYTERLNDPLLELVAPDIELSSAKKRQKRQLAYTMLMNYGLPRAPMVEGRLMRFFQNYPGLSIKLFLWMAKLFNGKRQQENALDNSKDAIFRLHNAGVPIVMGSDAAYTPSSLYAFHGISSLREIELLGEAGLKPQDAIKAATQTPAQMLGLSHEIGTIEVNKKADLAIFRENPLVDLSALRSIQWTVKNGVALRPKEWMAH